MHQLNRSSASGEITYKTFAVALCLFFGAFADAGTPTSTTGDEVPTEDAGKGSPEKDQGATFVLLKDSGFGGFMVAKGTDFSVFDTALFFPTNLEELEISSKTSRDIARSWRRAPDEEIDNIGQHMDDKVEDVFRNAEILPLTKDGDDNALAVQIRLTEFVPMMIRPEDAYGGTIGSARDRGKLGVIKVTAVLVDAGARQMVGVIEDVISLRLKQTQRNTRATQTHIWRKSFKDWLTKLHGMLEKLQSAGPVGM